MTGGNPAFPGHDVLVTPRPPRSGRPSIGQASPAGPRSLLRSDLIVVVGTVAAAAAVTGAAEIVLRRIAAPIASHVPGSPVGSGVGDALRSSGELAFGATAVLVLVLAAALGLALALQWRQRALATSLFVMLGATLVVAAWPGPVIGLAAYAVTVITVAVVVVGAVRRSSVLHGLAIVAFGAGFLAGISPYVGESLATYGWGLGLSPSWTRTFAEAALIVGVVLLGAGAVHGGMRGRAGWWVGAGAGLATAAMLAVQPEHTAIVSLWAIGVTLALSPFAYIVAAAALGLTLTEWLTRPSLRQRAAGLVLVIVAGVGPGAIHHNLTLVVALVLLALPMRSGARVATAGHASEHT